MIKFTDLTIDEGHFMPKIVLSCWEKKMFKIEKFMKNYVKRTYLQLTLNDLTPTASCAFDHDDRDIRRKDKKATQ